MLARLNPNIAGRGSDEFSHHLEGMLIHAVSHAHLPDSDQECSGKALSH